MCASIAPVPASTNASSNQHWLDWKSPGCPHVERVCRRVVSLPADSLPVLAFRGDIYVALAGVVTVLPGLGLLLARGIRETTADSLRLRVERARLA